MPEYRVLPTDPARIARAVVRYQVTRPRFLVIIALMLVGIAAVTSGSGVATVVAVEVVAVLALGGYLLYSPRKMATTLSARGYRPGSTLGVVYGGRGFTITTDSASARHDYTEIAHAWRVRDVVLLRLGTAKYLLALPLEVVPEPWLDRVLRAGARA